MSSPNSPRVVIVMGVSGCGKSTIAAMLAGRMHWEFEEGDALHPPANVAKMASGQPLNDEDRAPWLEAVAAQIDAWRTTGRSGVITCSALKRRYRDILIGDRPDVRLAFLKGSKEVIANRLAARQGHFMPAALLDSQLATLEAPSEDEHPITVEIGPRPEVIVARIAEQLEQ
ncbi:gluconokinase [Aliidongia dinghuensis]|uniref:Gluconokinase n=1 Tax=Aliidongia dinghuensis TaxID=1867774 RepID=A0A8J3E1H4_9PROT|nr:gluconokinase [Aliidongia dinghuensis]GGF02125.1 gluconokinase [Aliidongia dinghuensis]